jgi:hypothetical protein
MVVTMNLDRTEKHCISLLDTAYRQDLNHIKIHSSNKELHELAKSRVCYYLKKNNRKYVTEAILKDKIGRIDVYDISWDIAYEIVNTETEKEKENKQKVYPVGKIVFLDAKTIMDCKEDYLFAYLN